MKLSIIIVHYNTPELLRQCLDSLIGKELPDNWEIIVVDNNSNIKYQISNLKNAYKKSNINYIPNTKNVGYSKANNIGIKRSSGKYVLLLNPDTIVSQAAIQKVLDYLDTHSDVGIATCRVELSSGELDDACHRGFPTPWNAFCHFSGIASLFPHSLFFNGYHLGYRNMDQVHEIDACVGAFMMIRRTIGDEFNWLDEDYFWYGEDLDFCYKVKQKGWKIVYLPDKKIIHYKGIASGIKNYTELQSTATPQTRRLAQKARFDAMRIFYRKHYRNQYPRIITVIVEKGIAVLGWLHTV